MKQHERVTAGHMVMIAVVLGVFTLPFILAPEVQRRGERRALWVMADTPGKKPTPPTTVINARQQLADQQLRQVRADFGCKPVRKDAEGSAEQFPVPMPPFSKDVFPCTRCHDKPNDFNATKRTLTLDHLNIKLVHGPREQWCYGCHNPTNRDQLRLAGGRLVSFRKSYELCGQCHGPKLRDWRLGIHGRRIGCWNGKKQYLLCVHCHSPHAPRFPAIEPRPRPRKPSELH